MWACKRCRKGTWHGRTFVNIDKWAAASDVIATDISHRAQGTKMNKDILIIFKLSPWINLLIGFWMIKKYGDLTSFRT